MTGKVLRSIFTQDVRCRCLASFLLFALTCGTVAEFTHSHRDRANQPVTNVESGAVDSGCIDVLQSDDPTTSSSRSKTAAECLICQLHQNLSNTTVTHSLATGPTEAHSFAPSAKLNFHRGDFSASQRGRAPPTNL